MKYILISLITLALVSCGSKDPSSDSNTPIVIVNAAPTASAPIPSPSSSAAPAPTTTASTTIANPCLVENSDWTSSNGGCHSTVNSLTLSGISSSLVNEGAGETYCNNLVESGYSDWRLPVYTELSTLLTLNQGNFNTNNKFDFLVIDFLNREVGSHWTPPSTLVTFLPTQASDSVFCVR